MDDGSDPRCLRGCGTCFASGDELLLLRSPVGGEEAQLINWIDESPIVRDSLVAAVENDVRLERPLRTLPRKRCRAGGTKVARLGKRRVAVEFGIGDLHSIGVSPHSKGVPCLPWIMDSLDEIAVRIVNAIGCIGVAGCDAEETPRRALCFASSAGELVDGGGPRRRTASIPAVGRCDRERECSPARGGGAFGLSSRVDRDRTVQLRSVTA